LKTNLISTHHDAGVIAEIQAGTYVGFAKLSDTEYFSADKYASNTFLNIMEDKTPAHARCAQINGTKTTPAMAFGSAFHAALLEPHAFQHEYAVKPRSEDYPHTIDTVDQIKERLKVLDQPVGGTRAVLMARLKISDPETVFWDDLYDSIVRNKTVLSYDDNAALSLMRQSVLEHQGASALFKLGAPEIAMFWQDQDTGVMCKGKVDWLCLDLGYIADVKTTICASEYEFAKTAANLKYHRQAAFYLDGFNAIADAGATEFVNIVVEKTPDIVNAAGDLRHAVAIRMLDDASVEVGRVEYKRNLAVYAECVRTGIWPGYGSGITASALPHWAFK